MQAADLATAPVTLVFFGYTHCPDICNVVLANIASALRGAEPGGARATSGCCSSRPTRLATPPTWCASTWTGSTRRTRAWSRRSATVEKAAKALYISYEKPDGSHGGSYEVDHGTYTTGFVDGKARRGLVGRHQRRRPARRPHPARPASLTGR